MTRWSDVDRMFGAMGLLRDRLDTMFNEIDRSYGYGPEWAFSGSLPRTVLCDKGEVLELKAEVPGMKSEDLSVKIQGNYLEISGARKIKAPDGYTVHRRERNTESFSRSLTLPADVDSSKVTASLKDGILLLQLPKAEAAKPRVITID